MISHISNIFILFIFFTTFLCLSLSNGIPTKYSSILGPNFDKLPTKDEAIELFKLWRKEHGRVYNDLEETTKKFDIFLSNLRIITESNANRKSSHDFLLGLTKFADWSSKEFQETYLYNLDMANDNETMNLQVDDIDHSSYSVSSSLDWSSLGAVTPVKDQQKCGCCWAFTAVGAIEGLVAIETGKLINLSNQELLDCAVSQGCKGGKVSNAFKWVVRNNGIALENNYPYIGQQGLYCKATEIPNSANTSISTYSHVAESDNELLYATAKQPIIACIYVIEKELQHYQSKIYEGRNCPVNSKEVNHCMLIVGYSSISGRDYWILKNSWGNTWGDDGYMYIKRNTGKMYGVCGINAWAYYPVKNNGAFSN